MTARRIYELDEDRIARARGTELPTGLVAAAETGARACPIAALRFLP